MRNHQNRAMWLLLLGATSCAAEQATTERPAGRNRLGEETSPYLRSHADNPVHWYAWGPEAFGAAKQQNKPVFLSIGYSACHWCHVMNRETFSDPEIAKYLNEHFICIKVDREERPDVDKLYMNAVQALTGHGGWPLSAFLLPDGRPFFGGTYYPPRDKQVQGGVLPGFERVATSVKNLMDTRREDVVKQADAVCNHLRLTAEAPDLTNTPLDRQIIDKAIATLQTGVDPVHAGFARGPGFAPKFPQPNLGLLLIDAAKTRDQRELLGPVIEQADHMARGGIYDQVGGGFHRYSVDREWLVPHFEKMLYDQAQLLSLYSRLHKLAPQRHYERVVDQTIEFVEREMTSPEGLFYSALDADSEHEEGKFYIWTAKEFETIANDDADWAKTLAGVDGQPNFEGKYILTRTKPLAEVAQAEGVTEAELLAKWDRLRADLLKYREQRVRPLLDTKILTSWNALMIVGLTDAAEAFGNEKYKGIAVRAADQLLAKLRGDEGDLFRQRTEGQTKGRGFAEDYASSVLAMLAVHRLTSDDKYLTAARELMDRLVADFWDDKGKGFFYTGRNHETLVAPLKESYDGAFPSANSMAAVALVNLAGSGPAEHRNAYLKRTADLFSAFARDLSQNPYSATMMIRALNHYLMLAPEARVKAASDAATTTASVKFGPEDPLEKIDVAPSTLPAKPEQEFELQVTIHVREGWHINANPAKPDFLIPTVVKVKEENAIRDLKISYPTGKPVLVAGMNEPISAYEEKATIKVTGRLNQSAKNLTLQIRYQACDDKKCLAPTTKQLTIPVQSE